MGALHTLDAYRGFKPGVLDNGVCHSIEIDKHTIPF
jgi:hypothetical protein